MTASDKLHRFLVTKSPEELSEFLKPFGLSSFYGQRDAWQRDRIKEVLLFEHTERGKYDQILRAAGIPSDLTVSQKQSRNAWIAAVAAAVIAVVSLVLGVLREGYAEGYPEFIRARELVIIDEIGRERATLKSKDTEVLFELLNQGGKPGLRAGVYDGFLGSFLVVAHAGEKNEVVQGEERKLIDRSFSVHVTATPRRAGVTVDTFEKETTVSSGDQPGGEGKKEGSSRILSVTPRLELCVEDSNNDQSADVFLPSIRLADENAIRLALGFSTSSGEAFLSLGDKKGKTRGAFGLTSSDRATLILMDSQGRMRAALGSVELKGSDGTRTITPESSISLFDSDGKVNWTAPE